MFEKLPLHRNGVAFEQSKEDAKVTTDELDYLLPDVWLQSHPECKWTIDEVRRKERENTEKRRRQLRKERLRKEQIG